MIRLHKLLLICLLLAQCITASASVKLFDFETQDELSAWTLRSPDQDSLKLSAKYATIGARSLEFFTPRWKAGMEKWPAFEGIPSIKDWNGFDRLVIDITNPSPESFTLCMHISDSKLQFRKGLYHEYVLPANGVRRYVVELSKMPAVVDKSDISLLHFYILCPTRDTRIYVDNVVLLRPGELLPEVSGSMLKQQYDFFRYIASQAQYAAGECQRILDKNDDARLTVIAKELDVIGKISYTSFDSLVAASDRIVTDINQLERLLSMLELKVDLEKLEIPTKVMLVAFTGPTNKVLPKGIALDLNAAKSVAISAARNEHESFQVAVMPSGINTLSAVTVSVSDLKSRSGDTFAADNIDCDVVGYVKTKPPCYPVSYAGWWPDPLLNFLGPINIDWEDVQTFWVRIRVPKDQAPGIYKGKLAVAAQGIKPLTFDLSLQVRSFTMPDCAPLPTAITAIHGEFKNRIIKDICGEENWNKKLKFEYADFLADYYINFDSLYEPSSPDYDILKHLHDKGKLVAFNIGCIENTDRSIDHFKPIYEKCKEMGILDHAYIYGFDEAAPAKFAEIAGATDGLKKAYPDVFFVTTAKDPSYGTDSVMKSIDAFCPLTPFYDAKKAEDARTAGKKVWWYICCGPRNPYANWFVDYSAIDIRLLMGAMTTKYNPDGFLYWSLSCWNDNKPIISGPFTSWNPRSYTDYNGDGSIFCCGPGGKPIPTIRLENYRDGLEDLAYVRILQSIIDKYAVKGDALTGGERKWLNDARKALVVPNNLVNDMADYSHDSKSLEAWRDRIADLIDSSGMSDTNPWSHNFGVRGFSN